MYANAATGLLLLAVNIVVQFLLTPTVVHALGDRDYGIWDLLLAICGYLGILELGLGPAIVRYVAVANRNEDAADLRRLFNSAMAIFGLLGAVSLAAMLAFAAFPEPILGLERGTLPHASLLFAILGANLALQFPGTVLTGYVMGLQRHSYLDLARCVLTVLGAIATWFALTRWEGPKLVALAVITLAGNLLLYGGIAVALLLRERRLRLGRADVEWATMRRLLGFGLKSMLLMVSERIRRAAMPFVIAHVAGVQAVVLFSIPSRLADQVGQLGRSLGFPLTPYFGALSQKQDRDTVRREWLDLSRYTQCVNLGAAISLGALGYEFIRRWMGASYAEQGLGVLVWMTLGLLLQGLSDNAGRLLVGFARQEVSIRILLPASVLAVLAAIPLTASMGVTGTAMALFVTGDVATLLVLYASCQVLDLRLGEYFRRTALHHWIPVVAMVLAYAAMRLAVRPTTYPLMLLHAGVGVLAYALAAWRYSLTAAERERLRAWRRSRRAGSAPRDDARG